MAKVSDLLKNQKFRRVAIMLGIALILGWSVTFCNRKEVPQNSSSYSTVGGKLVQSAEDSITVDTPLKERESRKRMEQRAKQAEEQGQTSVELRQTMEQPSIAARLPEPKQREERRTFTRLPVQIKPQEAPPPPQPREKDQALEERVAQMLGGAATLSWGNPGTVEMGGYTALLAKKESEKAQEQPKQETVSDQKAVLPNIGIPAGEILYAIMDTASDSDQASTPVMATIISGKWRGAKCIGSFQRLDERLVVQFSKMIFKQQEYGINGYAIDPKTSLPGVRSSVDTHFLERWGGLIASSFLQGFGQVLQNQGSTTQITATGTTNWRPKLNPEEQIWAALGVTGEKAGQQFEKNFDRPPTVTLKAGTEIGILIL